MTRPVTGVAVLFVLCSAPGAAQRAHWRVHAAGQAVPTLTTAAPTPRNRGSATEFRVVHPVLLVHATPGERRLGRVTLIATVNFEAWTIPHGELLPGMWGEGYVDRRHPHTFAHELMLVFRRSAAGLPVVFAAGKGFVPFGTDDPMTRAPLRYPINHHLSQIPERALALVAVAPGQVLLEAALFNGDEPEGPDSWPNLSRFGDSWAVRLTGRPGHGVELQGSLASVRSPEHRPGSGPLDHKWNASVRWSGSLHGQRATALVEAARTSSAGGAYALGTVLAEAAVVTGRHRPYVRIERSDRPEEERISDYRSVRPPVDDALLGITRWTILTVGYGMRAPTSGPLELRPFLEASLGHVAHVSGLFDPALYYGSTTLRSLTVGLRLTAAMENHRMGRYADAPTGGGHH